MSTVDSFEMGLLHRAFRKAFGEVSQLLRSVQAGDTERAALVGAHVDFLLVALHHHHGAEDELLWPKLHTRVPDHEAEVRKIEDQHAEIAASVDSLRSLLPPWTDSAEFGLVSPLASVAEQLSEQIDRHLCDEEQHVVPLINEHLTPQEWEEFLELGSSFLSEDNLKYGLALAGMVRDRASHDEWQRFLASSPPFVQFMWNERGNYTYTKYIAALKVSGT